jgi:Zn-dependent protease
VTSFAIPQSICAQCQAQLAPALLACPRCGSLVHAGRLQELAVIARTATDNDDVAGALAAAGAVLLFFLTKAKLLLLGLANWSTLASMLLSLGVYWTAWGWKFALGIVISIYIHEMGHVVALRRFGFKATAALFIPGLGAVIRLQQRVANPREDAAIGLAGPIYGLGAALASAGLWVATKHPIFGAIASVGAWINLLNLTPVWTLDGGRAFHALSRGQRWLCALAAGASWYFVRDGMLLLLLIVIGLRALAEPRINRAIEAQRRNSWFSLSLSRCCV